MSDSDPTKRFVSMIRGLSEVITTHGMAPASFACGVTFAFFAMFRSSESHTFATYGGLAVGSVLMIVGVILHVWKTSRENPRTFPHPPPLDPQFVETLELLRNLVSEKTLPAPPSDPPKPDVTSEDDKPE